MRQSVITVGVGVRLTDGLNDTVVDGTSARAVVSYTRFSHFNSLWCSVGFALHGWLTGALLQEEVKHFSY